MAAPPQQGQSDNNSMGILWIVAAILIFSAIIWMAFKRVIVAIYFKIKLAEIAFLSIFTSSLEDTRAAIINMDPTTITFQEMMKVGDAVGSELRYPLVLLIFILAVLIYFTNSVRVYRRIYSMRDLLQVESPNWPQISPVVKLDLVKTDIDKGPWAMAMTPMQFCKRYDLLETHKRQRQEGMIRKEWNRVEVTLKRGQANKIFSTQLGPLWQGIDKLPAYMRALFAIFAARLNGDTKVAFELMKKINVSYETKLDFTGADELCKKYESSKSVKKLIQSHAYVLTVMATMLEGARLDGVQATADFLWLKVIDRRLWYMLNTVGRQTPFVEVAGPFAHWIAEKAIGRHLLVPMVEEATNALDLALKEIVYQPDEKE
jgi:intracellular multiplication protein IcmP